MVIPMNNDMLHIVILDVSGLYAHIYDQGYFESDTLTEIQKKYSDPQHWRVVVI